MNWKKMYNYQVLKLVLWYQKQMNWKESQISKIRKGLRVGIRNKWTESRLVVESPIHLHRVSETNELKVVYHFAVYRTAYNSIRNKWTERLAQMVLQDTLSNKYQKQMNWKMKHTISSLIHNIEQYQKQMNWKT